MVHLLDASVVSLLYPYPYYHHRQHHSKIQFYYKLPALLAASCAGLCCFAESKLIPRFAHITSEMIMFQK